MPSLTREQLEERCRVLAERDRCHWEERRKLERERDEARLEAEEMRDRFLDSEQDREDTINRYVTWTLKWEEDPND